MNVSARERIGGSGGPVVRRSRPICKIRIAITASVGDMNPSQTLNVMNVMNLPTYQGGVRNKPARD